MPATSLHLPQPSTTQLAAPPLQFVVCQVQHNRNVAVGDAGRVLAVQERMADDLDERLVLEEQTQHEVNLAFGPGGMQQLPPVAEQQRGWRIRSVDDSFVVALQPEFFALESTSYTSWTDFRRRLISLYSAVEDVLAPGVQLRLGLRYIDRLVLPEVADPRDWRNWIHESLVGALDHPDLATAVLGVQSLLQLQGADGAQVLLRHGSQRDPDGTCPYVLDTDCFRVATKRFDVGQMQTEADELHRLALQLFQASLSPSLRRRLETGA